MIKETTTLVNNDGVAYDNMEDLLISYNTDNPDRATIIQFLKQNHDTMDNVSFIENNTGLKFIRIWTNDKWTEFVGLMDNTVASGWTVTMTTEELEDG